MLSKGGGEGGEKEGGGRERVGRELVSLEARAETTLWWLIATLALTQPAEAKASNKEKQVLGMTRKSYLALQG